jgi:spore coat protein A
MLSRRNFLKLSIAGGAATYVATRRNFFKVARADQSPQTPLDSTTIPQFVDTLPSLDTIAAGPGQIELRMTEFQTQILPKHYPKTWVWGYLKPGQTSRASYLGPVIVATRKQPTEIKFVNNLGNSQSTHALAYKYSTDQTLHWADPLHGGASMWNHMAQPPDPDQEGAENYNGPIPACPHLHGGYVPPVLDGGPDSWFTSDGHYIGKGFYSKGWTQGDQPQNYCIYRYPNYQEGSPIWFHDHTLGATRLNVYMGLAGAYLITDSANDPQNLPPLVPLVIQDRMFDTNGQLFFPADSAGGNLESPNPEHPYWVPEFLGDTICVNGKTWPYIDLLPKRYTFIFVNGSNARSYGMYLVDPTSGNPGPPFWIIATDGGYLDKPVRLDPPASPASSTFLMMPGERYMVIIDFAGFQKGMRGPNGQKYSGHWLLGNAALSPYPNGDPLIPGATDRIMQLNAYGKPMTDTSFNPALPGAKVRQKPMVRLVDPVAGVPVVNIDKTRQLTLNEIAIDVSRITIDPVTGLEVTYEGGPIEILVNNTKWDGMRITGTEPGDEGEMYTMEPIDESWPTDLDGNFISEFPKEGQTELWEIVNLTADAHPIHTHLVQFQLMNRQDFNADLYMSTNYSAAFPGGYDYTQKTDVTQGNFVPAFGPPLPYNIPINGKIGGNPDVTDFLRGEIQPPKPQEIGWKDTVMVLPRQVTRFIVRFALQEVAADTLPEDAALPFDPAALGGGYVWHCHIVDHEDNEMMRPDMIDPQPDVTREIVQGVDY